MTRKLFVLMVGTMLVSTASFSTVLAAKPASQASAGNCLKAFGHLIAPGWIKLNGSTSLGDNCVLPRGIAKKVETGTTTPPTPPTPDTTNPVISNLTVTPGRSTAFFRWLTDERADSTVFYSTTSPVAITATDTKMLSQAAYVFNHELQLTGLSASTTYYAIVRSKDPSGNTMLSPQTSFITVRDRTDTTAPGINTILTTVGTSSATLEWNTNEPATGRVYYGTSSPVDTLSTSTLSVGTSSLLSQHSFTLTNLATSTKYYYVLESKDALGNTRKSIEYRFTTGY